MKSLIVGAGFGQLYKSVLLELGHEVVLVDTNPATNPDFTNLDEAINSHAPFDTAHICVPNFLHYAISQQVAPHTKIVFVEKPGVSSPKEWENLLDSNRSTRFIMTKNNQWRSNIDKIKESAGDSDVVCIYWANKSRIPSPGSWFTDKSKAFGGVSRDLLPHLISIFIAINPDNYNEFELTMYRRTQVWSLEDCNGTDYGTINKNGVYDVDDRANMSLELDGKIYLFYADWRNESEDDIAIHFRKDGKKHIDSIPLGLCPEEAYKNMIVDCLEHLEDDRFWRRQREQDLYIQGLISEKSPITTH